MDRSKDAAAHSGHRARMRQRVQNEGFEGLKPHEIIEYLLFYAIPRQNVNGLAHQLIDRFGSVQGVLSASLPELQSVPGVGAHAARWLALVGEAVAACAGLTAGDRHRIEFYSHAYRYAERLERKLVPPCCVQLCLDAGRRLLYCREICSSLSWGEPATLREALSDMFAVQARYAILLVYTGTRVPEPDDYDFRCAAEYAATLNATGCQLLDVIHASGGEIHSMRRADQIPAADETEYARFVREDYLREAPEESWDTYDPD